MPAALCYCGCTAVCEVASDVLLGSGERYLVDPVVDFGEFFLAEGRRVHLNYEKNITPSMQLAYSAESK